MSEPIVEVDGNDITVVDIAASFGDTLPSQSGNSGKYLTTDGAVLSWGSPAGAGTVTSVALTVPSWLSVTGSPITSSGTLAVTAATGQTKNRVLASPNGSDGAVTLRALVAADIPDLSATYAKLSGATFTGTIQGTKWSITDAGEIGGASGTVGAWTVEGIASAETVHITESHGLHILDSDQSHYAEIGFTANLTDHRLYSFVMPDANTVITFTGAATLSGTNTGDQNIFQTIAVSGQSNVVADSTTDTLTFAAGTGVTITTTAGSDTVTFAIGQAVSTSSSPTFLAGTFTSVGGTVTIDGNDGTVTTTGNGSIGGDLTVGGNLIVNGATVTINTATVEVEDSLMELAVGNVANSIDVGWYGNYQTASTPLYLGIVWDASSLKFRCFTGLQDEPTNTVNTSGTGYAVGTMVVNVEGTVNGVTLAGSGFTLTLGGNTTVTTFAATLLDDTSAGAVLTTLGGTTVGQAIFTLTNPGAVGFVRTNANNTVTHRTPYQALQDLHTLSSSIASAGTVDLSTGTGDFIHITGTTTITAFSGLAAGNAVDLVFDGALTLTHHATNLIIPGGANITTAAGDRCRLRCEATGQYRVMDYTPATGKAVVESVTTSNTATLTNKRITPRVTSETSSATPTINTDNSDIHRITALAAAVTSFTTNLSGTPTHGQKLIIEITDNGTARALTFGSSFEASGNVALPTTTVISTLLRIGFMWNSATSKWTCVAVA